MASRSLLSLAFAAVVCACAAPNGGAPATTAPAPSGSAAAATTAAATAGASASAGTSARDWPTYHGDDARTGTRTDVTSFSTVEVAWQTDALGGDAYAEPIVVRGTAIVATQRNVVFGFDARTGQQRWRTALGVPVDASTLPCGNIRPVSGITSTPVADAGSGLVYVVAFEQGYHHELYAIDVASGGVRFHRNVDAPGADPKVHQQRSALTLANGRVYVAYGGLFGDCGPYRGTVVGASATSPDAPLAVYRVPANREAGIWAPSGMAVDERGRLYAATGNSDSTGTFDYNDAVLRLAPDLALEDHWAPRDWLALSRGDIDLGSIGPTLLPGGFALIAGKNGVLYLLRAAQLGGIGGEAASSKLCASVFGGFAYADGVAYVPCTDGLAAVRIDGTSLRVAWRAARAVSGPPIVAGGAVWATDPGAGVLYAVDITSGSTRFQRELGAMQHFTTPTAYGDLILVAAGGRLVALRMR